MFVSLDRVQNGQIRTNVYQAAAPRRPTKTLAPFTSEVASGEAADLTRCKVDLSDILFHS